MGLEEYTAKRRFDSTPEPSGKERRAHRGPLRFVVQKHDASRLHYDFRLEMEGVLKSWAVPKGPSLNPSDKRLAIMTEDHPLEYGDFEGIIPEDNYGAGTVMLWDTGTYRAAGGSDARDDKKLLGGLKKGRLSIYLEGKRLKGEFSLVKIGGEENQWLLIKKDDAFARPGDILDEDTSVTTGRSMEEIAGEAEGEGEVWHSNRGDAPSLNLDDLPDGPLPKNVSPMLATLVDEPFDDEDWLFEIKWDGYRAVAEVNEGRVDFYSRNHKSFVDRYPEIVSALAGLKHTVVLDGELMVVDEKGRSQFQLLQNYGESSAGYLVYYAFDLLHLNGKDLRGQPLLRRKELLREILPELPNILYSDHIEETGIAFFEQARKAGLEGIIGKRAGSPYAEGRRTRDWLKIKLLLQQDAVIGGYTAPGGSRKHFGSLILGAYEGDRLVPIGQVGTGFSDKLLRALKEKMDGMERKTSPFAEKPQTSRGTTWLEPRLVCEVTFSEWTSDGSMRHPSFVGLREDKDPRDVHLETVRNSSEAVEEAEAQQAVEDEPPVEESTGERTSARKPAKRDRQLTINRKKVKVTNLDKVFWPEEGITKGDVIAYYRAVAPYILPHLKDRPESLHRHPNGYAGESFFQKDVGDLPPDWVETKPIRSDSSDKDIHYLICQDEATLVYLANLGCIELNPWLSRLGSLERPDFSVLDLDPVEVPFSDVVAVALAVGEVLGEIGVSACPKTSGSKGIHIYIPLAAKYSYEQSRTFAEIVAHFVHQRLPGITSLERSPSKRKKKVYLDYLQNVHGQTIAAPYCLRPRPGAPVSAPLEWEELTEDLTPQDFNIFTMPARLEEKGDLFAPALGEGIDIEACITRMMESNAK